MKGYPTVLAIIALMGVTVLADKGAFHTTAKNLTYFVNPEYLFTWYEAFLECSYRNMTLFSAEADEQFNDLFQLVTSKIYAKKPPNLWIGAVGANRKFVWVHSGKPVISRLWGAGNPDNSANIENCVQIFENTRHLNDIKCMEKMGFVCESRKPFEGGSGAKCDPEKSNSSQEKYKGIVFNFNQGK